MVCLSKRARSTLPGEPPSPPLLPSLLCPNPIDGLYALSDIAVDAASRANIVTAAASRGNRPGYLADIHLFVSLRV